MSEYHNVKFEREQETIPHRGIDRRDFLKLSGFTFAGALLGGCQAPKVDKAIPFLVKPEEITPGLSTFYATTCGGCNASCGIITKNRDGRPIKIEGNPSHPISQGGLCAVGQAHLLGLYDSHRLKNPTMLGKETVWNDIDSAIKNTLKEIQTNNGAVRFLSNTISSPTQRNTIAKFLSGFSNAQHIEYDALSVSAILDAHEKTHGTRVLPHYRFDKTEVIVSVDADFLGTWISPVEFTKDYHKGKILNGNNSKFSFHVQIEANVSLTGSNADKRISISPNAYKNFLYDLTTTIEGGKSSIAEVNELARKLLSAKGKSLVVCGVNDIELQLLSNYINHLLSNYGNTIDIETPSKQYRGNDTELQKLISEITEGKISALFIYNGNPLFDIPEGNALKKHIEAIPLSISFSERSDETSSATTFICPEHHSLESWNENEVRAGIYSLSQPVLQPLRNTRSLIESLNAWMDTPKTAYDAIRDEWKNSVFTMQKKENDFQKFWDKCVHDGFAEVESGKNTVQEFSKQSLQNISRSSETTAMALILYPKISIREGKHAHNPWLQELPDPITKIVWDNYVSLSKKTAEHLSVKENDVVEITAQISNERRTLKLPTHIQQGMCDNVVAVALGYGRKGTERFTNIGPEWFEAKPTVNQGELVGKNAAVFLQFVNGSISYNLLQCSVSKTKEQYRLAATQEYHSLQMPEHLVPAGSERRPIIQETTFGAYIQDNSAGSFSKHEYESIWPEEHQYNNHHWGMAIDLTKCTGCSGCVIGCQSENNIPCVGKDEIARNREMTWIRIDRYFQEEENTFSVAFQPMMCHHCNNAPCETVCPVLATVHNEEGLNQQIYNRCVGTRYCSNNCPYKVRRFNWFDYEHGDEMQKLVLNPDVVVRERGVMEKCSFCIQRIQEAKIIAKSNGVALKDGDIQPACQQSCPANAIVFGDMNDKNSELSKRMNDKRYYKVLEEVGTRPAVGYMTLVRNSDEVNNV